MSRVIVPVPCHFIAPRVLCSTTVARMRTALNVAKSDDVLLLSGDVPYTPDGLTLGALMREWFMQNNIPAESICVLRGGVGTFSEARATTEVVPYLEVREIIIVSSDWYLSAGKQIWRRRAKENNLTVSFASIPHTGGVRTRVVYSILGAVFRTTIAAGFEKSLERSVTAAQQKRTKGFTTNGCA
ncbi:MAG: ElyC/SanA/YdcF family protein [bacterium]|nr:ElyC/SanA/YdcF family protein [bacterium]